MTRAEILAKRPGKEMNRLVAERVMGYTWLKEGAWKTGKMNKPSGWSPSTDMAPAWEVVSELERRGLVVVYRTYGFRAGLCRVEVTSAGGGELLGYAEAVTAPAAICKAALIVSREVGFS